MHMHPSQLVHCRMTCKRLSCLAFCLAVFAIIPRATAAELLPAERTIPEAIDYYLDQGLASRGIATAPQALPEVVLRRTMLDLVGRIPTSHELAQFLASNEADKRARLVEQLMSSPGYVRHNAREFDRLLSAENENAPSLEAYLIDAMKQRKSWDRMFAELLGASAEPNDGAAQFVIGRLSDRDSLTRDLSSVFFGVNVSCCQCHDHPTVDYLSQDFYFGLKAFFHRSYEFQGRLLDREFAEPMKFKPKMGEEKEARLLLVSGTSADPTAVGVENLKGKIEEEDKLIARFRAEFGEKKQYPPPPAFVPRKSLVEIALQPGERDWLAKSIVNRLWYRFFGYALVMRVDQMHPENPPSHPELLNWLARDFVDHGYDLHRLIQGIVLSRAYSRVSNWDASPPPPGEAFAVAVVRPLSPVQFALSLRVASRPDLLNMEMTSEQLDQQLLKLEDEAKKTIAPLLPHPIEGLQIGVSEALQLSNDPELLALSGEGLVSLLVPLGTADEAVDMAFRTVLSRSPDQDERQAIQAYVRAAAAELPMPLREKLALVQRSQLQIPQLEQQQKSIEEQAVQQGLRGILERTEDYLSLAAEQFATDDDATLNSRLQSLNLDPIVYRNWRNYLGLRIAGSENDPQNVLANHFTEVMNEAFGNSQFVGLGTPQTPCVLVNQTDQDSPLLPAKRVTVHPSPTQAVVVGWRSPISGSINVSVTVQDRDAGGGNGIASFVQLHSVRGVSLLATSEIANGGRFSFQSSSQIAVSEGDVVALVVDPLQSNHGFDTTEVDFQILEVGPMQRKWDLNRDVATSIRQNPHGDSHGHAEVWHFCMTGKPRPRYAAGSTIEEWMATLQRKNGNEARLKELSTKIQLMLLAAQSAGQSEADSKTRAQLTGKDSPLAAGLDRAALISPQARSQLDALNQSLAAARENSTLKPSEDEQALIEKARRMWQQVVWAMLASAEFRFIP